MEYRWINTDEIETFVNPALGRHGWALLNLDSCRVLGAVDDDGNIVEVLVLQLHPIMGPLLRLREEPRDGGATTKALAAAMEAYLRKEEARGFLAVAESPVTQRLCERFGMTKLEAPVYSFVRKEEVPT